MFSKLVCRSLPRIAMITNIDFPVQTNFTIHAHIFAVYSCPRLQFIDPTDINRAKRFFHNFFSQGSHLNIKGIYWSTSPQILTILSFFQNIRSKRRAYYICYIFCSINSDYDVASMYKLWYFNCIFIEREVSLNLKSNRQLWLCKLFWTLSAVFPLKLYVVLYIINR